MAWGRGKPRPYKFEIWESGLGEGVEHAEDYCGS